jgi:hypothetical protein
VICAIAPNGFKHIRIPEDLGTTKAIFFEYMSNLTDPIAIFPGWHGQKYVMWDNLTAHNCHAVMNHCLLKNLLPVPRVLYWCVDEPIEFIFNHFEC